MTRDTLPRGAGKTAPTNDEGPTVATVAPQSRAVFGRHGEGKGAFENTILRARRGELKQFTGIDSAYEPPERSEVTLDCGDLTAAQALSTLLSRLRL